MKPLATPLVRHQFVIVVVACIALLTNLGATRLWDQDEAYFAGAAAEMFARGDWVTPQFNQELFAHKPPLMYWLMIGGYQLFGRTEFAARIGSALLGVATGLLVYHTGRRLFSPSVGLWSALAMVTCLMFDIVARAATPDCHLVFFTALSIYFFATRCPEGRLVAHEGGASEEDTSGEAPGRWRSLIGWSLVYAAMGLAVLAKGPIGFLLPCCVIGLYLMLSTPRTADRALGESTGFRRRAWEILARLSPLSFLQAAWRMKPWVLLAVVTLTAGPWFLLVHLRTGGVFTHDFVWTHHVQRFLEPLDNHQGPWWYYAPAMLAGFFPWSVFIVPAAVEMFRLIRHGGRPGRAALLLLCWCLVFFVFFSRASTKLPNYILPAYPALAIIVGCFVERWRRAPQEIGLAWTRCALAALAICGLLLSFSYVAVTTKGPHGHTLLDTLDATPLLADDFVWAAWLGVLTFAGALLCLGFDLMNRRAWVLPAFAATALLFVTGALGGVALRIDRHQPSEALANAIRENSDGSPVVAQYGYFRPSLVYYTQGRLKACKSKRDVARLLRESTNAYVVVPDDKYQLLRSKLPVGVRVIARQPRFPKRGEILVLSNSNPHLAGKTPATRH